MKLFNLEKIKAKVIIFLIATVTGSALLHHNDVWANSVDEYVKAMPPFTIVMVVTGCEKGTDGDVIRYLVNGLSKEGQLKWWISPNLDAVTTTLEEGVMLGHLFNMTYTIPDEYCNSKELDKLGDGRGA
jgi:hypothetical protein